MSEMRRKNLLVPDETVEFDHGRMASVRIGALTTTPAPSPALM